MKSANNNIKIVWFPVDYIGMDVYCVQFNASGVCVINILLNSYLNYLYFIKDCSI